MEPRFVIHSHYSEEEFVRYNRTIQYKLLHLKRNIIVTNVALLAMIVSQFVMGQYYYGIAMLIILAAANWYFFIGIDRKAKQLYRKNPFIQENVTFELVFHDDHYDGASENGTSSVPYSKPQTIIETPTDFYIMHTLSSGTIIPKGDCPEGFDDFIRQVKSRYNK